MPIQTIQKLIWDAILILRESELMTNKEAASIALVRFTWTPKEAKAKLIELQERYIKNNNQAHE